MKLWQKLSVMTVAVLLVTTGISGSALLWHSAHDNEEKIRERYEQQVKSAALALKGDMNGRAVETYSDVTKGSYLDFWVKKYGADQYILLHEDEVICNATPYDLTDSGRRRLGNSPEGSIIQRNGRQHVLAAEHAFFTNGGGQYALVLVQDISEVYAEIRKQALLFTAFYLAGAFAAVILLFFFTKKILEPLQALQYAAEEIQSGRLSCRAEVKKKDEIGVVAEAFNGMAARIEEQVTELSAVSEQRKQMLGSLAHELKTPMTSIIGYTDTLLHVNVREEQRERALFHIYEESRRLERLGSKLMNLIGLYDNDSIFLEKTDMEALFLRAAELMKQSLEQKGIHLQVDCRMQERLVDRDLMESLLINLIDNGIKASEAGDTIFLEGAENRITVRDQGCGIAAEELDRVTEAFYMADKARGRKAGGCGLGLSLCSRIAQLHGARLVIESEEGRGTSVSLWFEEKEEHTDEK